MVDDDILYPRIAVSYSSNRFCTEDDQCGDSVYCEHSEESHGWEIPPEDGHPCHPDLYDVEDGITAVDKAVDYLLEEGAYETSASYGHVTGVGEWYTAYEDSYSALQYHDVDHYERSFHLYGFTESEQRMIWRRFHEQLTAWS